MNRRIHLFRTAAALAALAFASTSILADPPSGKSPESPPGIIFRVGDQQPISANDLPGSVIFVRPFQQQPEFAKGLPTHAQLAEALKKIVDVGGDNNGGFGLNMWATIVNRDGIVCGIAFSGKDRGDQWPGSRVISAQKANTANSFSLPKLSLSTANLYSAVQPGGSLFGLQHSNPVDTENAYKGPSSNYGQNDDPLVGQKVGGVNVFAGGLALYNKDGKLVGGIGVSGDSSCTDHNVAWKLRHALNLDNVPGGVNPVSHDDNIVYDITLDAHGHPVSASGWGHPDCGLGEKAIAEKLPKDFPIGPNP